MKVKFVIALTIVVSGCSSLSGWSNLVADVDDEIAIYVVNRGWHTGIVIVANNLGPELLFLEDYFDSSKFYEFGWGDKGFY